MAKTIAELQRVTDTLSERLQGVRAETDELWALVEKFREQLTRADLAVTQEQVAQLKVLVDQARNADEELIRLVTTHREEFVALRTQLQEHVKQYEKWDARRWGLIGVFVASLLSLVANLIVIALRTPTK